MRASGLVTADLTPRDGSCRPHALKRAGLLRRIVTVIAAVQRRQTDRALARFILGSGGRLTDAIEREMMRHHSACQSGFGSEDAAQRVKDDKPLAPRCWF